MKEMTFSKNFEERVFSDHRQDKFWLVITTVVKKGKLEAIDFLWNFTPVTMNRNRTQESPYMNWCVDCFMKMNSIYGAEAVAKAVVRAEALSFANLNEEVHRMFVAQKTVTKD